ncbi:MAG: hypothetical protein ABH834_01875, partial [Candidatus Altiarchaeota archaeon]
ILGVLWSLSPLLANILLQGHYSEKLEKILIFPMRVAGILGFRYILMIIAAPIITAITIGFLFAFAFRFFEEGGDN